MPPLSSADIAALVDVDAPQVELDAQGLIPDMPDRVWVITWTGGPGLALDDEVDGQTIQVRCRDATDQAARTLAFDLDAALRDLRNVQVGGRHIVRIVRFGSPPSVVGADAGGRVAYTANYLVEAQAD